MLSSSFSFFTGSSLLVSQRATKYHPGEMSDLYGNLWRKRQKLLAEAISLDFVMWKARHDKPEFPFTLGPEAISKCHCAKLAQEIYFEKKPPPRHSVALSRQIEDLCYGDLQRLTSKKPRSDAVKKIALELRLSSRDVRRKLALLRQQGKIPADWFNGYQWFPPVEDALQAIRNSRVKAHAAHTHPSDDSYASYVMQCRKRAEKLNRDLNEIEDVRKTCEHWCDITSTYPSRRFKAGAFHRHFVRANRRAYDSLAKLAEQKRPSFCKLFVAVYEALQNDSKTPVEDAKASVGLSHAAFYRAYTSSDVREATRLAKRVLADDDPDWLGYRSQTVSRDDSAIAFSDWTNKVSEEDLWADTR